MDVFDSYEFIILFNMEHAPLKGIEKNIVVVFFEIHFDAINVKLIINNLYNIFCSVAYRHVSDLFLFVVKTL